LQKRTSARSPRRTPFPPAFDYRHRPEHAWLADQRRAEYSAVSDQAALDAARLLSRTEGIIPALESAHAIAGLIERLPQLKKDDLVILNLSAAATRTWTLTPACSNLYWFSVFSCQFSVGAEEDKSF